jgi:type IV pilus assembly protein PilW
MCRSEADLYPFPSRNKGFSLVEIMVALVIGMLAAIIIMQVFALSEDRKRTATSGGDALSGGVVALYAIQRDIRMSGYGIADQSLLGCNLVLPSGATLNVMAPVTINPAGITGQDPNTDILRVVYANTSGSPQGDPTILAGTATTYAVQTPNTFSVNDWVLAGPQTRPTPCNLVMGKVTNVAGSTVTVTAGTATTTGDHVFNLGAAPMVLVYAIRNGNLTVCDYMVNNCGSAANNASSAVWVPIENNIVSLRAQYGVDTSGTMDGIVDAYQQTIPSTSTLTACNMARISALRVALVARSVHFEKTAVTTAAPSWPGSAGAPIDVSKNSDGSANSYWQNYRYKLFQTVMPIRNVIWMDFSVLHGLGC